MSKVYNVHLYREMRLAYSGIEAASPEAAADKARDLATDQADSIDDCEGETLAALVDLVGDEEYSQTRLIDFEPARTCKSHAPGASPIVLVSVRGGLIEDLEATIPVTVVVEDWDVPDDATGEKPTVSVHTLTGDHSRLTADKLHQLIAID